jgi:hypothetical protein
MILKSQLEKIILEEAEKVLSERVVRLAISHYLTEEQIRNIRETGEIPEELIEGIMDWLRTKGKNITAVTTLAGVLMGPLAHTAMAAPSLAPSIEAPAEADNAAKNIETAEDTVRKSMEEWYKSDHSVNSYVHFMKKQYAPAFKDKSDEEIGDHYRDVFLKKILDIINPENLKVIDIDADVQGAPRWSRSSQGVPQGVVATFNDQQVGGLYNLPNNTIYLSSSNFEETNETDITTILATMEEEFGHAIDANITIGDLFPSLEGKPQADIKFGMSKAMTRSSMHDMIVSREDSGLDRRTYAYLTNPQEFWAKLDQIKKNLPSDFFNEAGEIDEKKLQILLNSNPSWEKPRDGGADLKRGQIDFRMFQILNSDAVEEIGSFFNQLVKADKEEPSSQTA